MGRKPGSKNKAPKQSNTKTKVIAELKKDKNYHEREITFIDKMISYIEEHK